MLERDKGHVADVVIQRLSEREWIPLFTLELEDGEEVKCSLRIMEREEVRTWADLNRLADWIRNEFEIYSCELSLTDALIEYRSMQDD
ncbi:MAG: hypothetical protein ACQEXI_16500 [Pseudomonadota bacterium]